MKLIVQKYFWYVLVAYFLLTIFYTKNFALIQTFLVDNNSDNKTNDKFYKNNHIFEFFIRRYTRQLKLMSLISF